VRERTNEQWLAELRGPNPDEALADLYELLVGGLRIGLGNYGGGVEAEDFAQEALIRIMGNLNSFRGESRFSTWAKKIAINFALTELKRRRWRDVSLPTKGFEGAENHLRWLRSYGAHIIHAPKGNSKKRSWSKPLRRWIAGIRQKVESVYEKLFNTFGLWRERPHELEGLRARLAARVPVHNFCIWLNDQLCRPRLACADLLGW
jgi:RNA polymerase sigma factor (sigma-70 family)